MKNSRTVVIVGGHEQACNMLEHLVKREDLEVALCIARKDDTGDDAIFPSLLRRCRAHDVPVIQPGKLNSPQVLTAVRRAKPDLVLSLQNNMLFGKEWLNLMSDRLGIVNVHYAPLPKYRGYWPEMWAIWNGERRFAVTMHYVDEGIDTGSIIAQRWFEVDALETRRSLYLKSTDACYQMLLDNLDSILMSKAECLPQNSEEHSYFGRALPNEGYLDLAWDAETQSRFLRAISFPGFPGPKIRIGDQVLTVMCEDLPFFAATGMHGSQSLER